MNPLPERDDPTEPERTTVFLIIDAGREDYVRADRMPFLHGLAQRGLRGSFISPPGFAQRTAFFTGRHPDVSGNLSAFVFDPEHSPFSWLRALGPLPRLVRPRRVFFPARMAIRAVSRRVSGMYHTDPAWIPPVYQPFFRPCEDARPVHDPGALGATSVFDLARAHGLSYTYRAHPVSGDDDAVCRELVRDLRGGGGARLQVAQFSMLDQQGHAHGPDSAYLQERCLAEVDRKLAEVHAALTAGCPSWDLFVCADHGMAPVRRRVDLLRALRRLPVKPARDYVVFVNSTLAVFWFLTEQGRRVLEPALARLEGGTVLTRDERHRRRIPTDRRWGDAMFAADPGVLFWPDYFHAVDNPVQGMHGYLDKSEEGYGMAVLASSDGAAGRGAFEARSLVDVFPTLCDLLGVPAPRDTGAEGRSVLPRHVLAA